MPWCRTPDPSHDATGGAPPSASRLADPATSGRGPVRPPRAFPQNSANALDQGPEARLENKNIPRRTRSNVHPSWSPPDASSDTTQTGGPAKGLLTAVG